MNTGEKIAFAAAIFTILAAFITLIGVWGQIRAKRNDDKLAAQLNRLNKQLSDLYGPLKSLYETGEEHWHAFLNNFSEDRQPNPRFKEFFPKRFPISPPNKDQLKAFRLWTENVFMPTNTRMEALIVNNAELLVGKDMPKWFLEFGVHVAALKPLMAKWKEPDFDPEDWKAHQVNFRHPEEFQDYVRASFEVLKREQSLVLAGKIKRVDEEKLENMIKEKMKQMEAVRNEERKKAEAFHSTAQLNPSAGNEVAAKKSVIDAAAKIRALD